MLNATKFSQLEIPRRRANAFCQLFLALAVVLGLAVSASTQSKLSADSRTTKAGATASQAQTKSAPAKKAPGKQPMAATHVVVTITPGTGDSAPTIDRDHVTLQANLGDDMEWVCSNNCDFVVIFIEAGKKPFKNRGFFKGKGKSGKVTGPDDTYKYWVIVGGGALDPDVIIKGSSLSKR